jgi:hypothetical protein
VPGLFDRTAPERRDVALVVKELLARRREEAAQIWPPRRGRAPQRWGPKRCTREALCDVAYRSFKALLS